MKYLPIGICILLAIVLSWQNVSFNIEDQQSYPTQGTPCVDYPVCSSEHLSWRQRIQCLRPNPLSEADYKNYAMVRLRRIGPEKVKGQFSLGVILNRVAQCIRHGGSPCVLHFAGDHGVGKSTTAEAISLSLGVKCGNPECTLGDTTLRLYGTAFNGLSAKEFRSMVVPVIVNHVRKYKRSVVLVEEFSSLSPDKVAVLLPLLGRSDHFPEHIDVKLNNAIVLLTSDFGKEGRTRGKSFLELEAFIASEFKTAFPNISTSYIDMFPFVPITLDAAYEIAQLKLKQFGCQQQVHLNLTDSALEYIIEWAKEKFVSGNGRAIHNIMERDLFPSLIDQLYAVPNKNSKQFTVDVTDNASFVIH